MEQLYSQRMNRLETVIALKEPDRVPFVPQTGDFVATAYGLSQYDLMKDLRNVIPCLKKYLTRFQPDLVWPVYGFSIDSCELLGAGFIRLPGSSHGLSHKHRALERLPTLDFHEVYDLKFMTVWGVLGQNDVKVAMETTDCNGLRSYPRLVPLFR